MSDEKKSGDNAWIIVPFVIGMIICEVAGLITAAEKGAGWFVAAFLMPPIAIVFGLGRLFG